MNNGSALKINQKSVNDSPGVVSNIFGLMKNIEK
jgi:hypothetical protein